MQKRLLLLAVCLAVLYAFADDRTLVRGEYWFDDQQNSRVSVSIAADGRMDFTADASQLAEGLHRLNYRALDSDGNWSSLHTWLFFRLPPSYAEGTNTLEYWIDDGTHVTHAISEGETTAFVIDASAVSEGMHSLNYRVKNSELHHSALHTWMFFRYVPEQVGECSLEYWIDEGIHQQLAIAENVIQFQVDASACSEGLHRLNYRLNNGDSEAGNVNTWLFYRVMPKEPIENVTLVYWFDDGQSKTSSINTDEMTFLADASSLSEGLHRFNYCISYNDNQVSDAHIWTFYKVSQQGRATSLKWYRVWWNNHEDKAIEVQLPNSTAEYLYEETLAVPEYARNDDWSRNSTATFHVVFCDDLGQLSPVESAEVPYPDIYPPRTTLTASLQADSVSLSWLANEDNVRDYNVYYSENGEPYVLWLPNTVSTEAVFRGQKGCTYRFLVTARDDKGNYEAMEESKAMKVEF